MKPEGTSVTVLSTTRARAKMHEFRVAPADFNQLPRDPAMLFALAIGILGDISASVADTIGALAPEGMPTPPGWRDGDNPSDAMRFASVFFDAYLNAQLDEEITVEFSLLCAASYYIGGNVGSAAVIARHMAAPNPNLAGGLGLLVYQILRNEFTPVEAQHQHQATTTELLNVLGNFFLVGAEEGDVADVSQRIRQYFHRAGSPRELLYADLAGAICALKVRNASRTILPSASGLAVNVGRPACVFRDHPATHSESIRPLIPGHPATL